MALATWAWWCCTATFGGLRPGEGVAGRGVVRVQVVGDHLGPDPEEALQPLDLLLEGARGLEVVEVADVRTQPGLVARGQAERVLEVRPAGEDRPPHGPAQADGPGHVPARPAEDRGPARDHARDRVVAAVLDLAVVGQEEVGDAAEPGERLAVLHRHRLVRQVPRGHHQRPPRGLEQQVVERRVGEDQADERIAGRDLGGEAGGGPSPHEDDRALDRGEQAPPRRRRAAPGPAPPRGRAP